MYTFGGEDGKMGREAKEGIDHAHKPCKEFKVYPRAMDFSSVLISIDLHFLLFKVIFLVW